MQTRVYFATNRGHEGPVRFKPLRYGSRFSTDGMENLRFGHVTFEVDPATVARLVAQVRPDTGPGDGEALQDYFAGCVAASQVIEAYPEQMPAEASEVGRSDVRLGSLGMFKDLQDDMRAGRDMLLAVHGYNVTWEQAVGTAAALEAMVNRPGGNDTLPQQAVRVVLFTWPSDGTALPFASYKSDRADARGSAGAVGRGLLKVRDFLHQLGRDRRDRRAGDAQMAAERQRLEASGLRGSEVDRALAQFEATEVCGRKLHLLAHSMGNYVLQNALARLWDNSPGNTLPRLFDHVFLCAADVDDDVLEPGQPLARLHQLAERVWVYHNAGDAALRVSDYTKGNPDRLGQRGAARPAQLHQKVHQVDCSAVVRGLTQHSYYTNGCVARDIRLALSGVAPDHPERGLLAGDERRWRMPAASA